MGRHKTGKKRKDRGSVGSDKASSVSSPHTKKTCVPKSGGDMDDINSESDSSSSESESEDDTDTMKTMIKGLAKSLKGQKKLLQGIVKKQDSISETVNGIETRIGRMDIAIAEQGKGINFVQNEVRELRHEHKQFKGVQNELVGRMDNQQTIVNNLMEQVNYMERKSREKNLRIVGYTEATGAEDTVNIVQTVLKEKFKMENVAVDAAHRTGKSIVVSGVRKPRHIIFRLVHYSDKHEVLKNKREALSGLDYYITDDMTKADMEKKRELQPVIDDAKRQQKKWKFRNGQLFINDRIYRGDTAPQQVQAASIQYRQHQQLPENPVQMAATQPGGMTYYSDVYAGQMMTQPSFQTQAQQPGFNPQQPGPRQQQVNFIQPQQPGNRMQQLGFLPQQPGMHVGMQPPMPGVQVQQVGMQMAPPMHPMGPQMQHSRMQQTPHPAGMQVHASSMQAPVPPVAAQHQGLQPEAQQQQMMNNDQAQGPTEQQRHGTEDVAT